MVKIIYGVCGEGRGHSSRSKEIISHLTKKHKVIVVTYGKAYDYLKKHFKTYKIYGLHMIYDKNRVKYVSTIINNISRLPKTIKSFKQINKLVKKFKPDIIFSDFEPITGIIAKVNKIPLISIDNQHILTNTKITIPKRYKNQAKIAKIITRLMLKDPKYYLVTTFIFPKITKKNTFLFPPIIRKEILKLKPKKQNYVLVYQTSESYTEMINILKKVNEKFIVYGFNKSKKDKNIIFKKPSIMGFIRDLKNCKAVITNGGFTLITESLYLKKPILSIPVKGQFEQVFNAIYIQKQSYGKHCDKLSLEKLKNFLKNLKIYEKKLKKKKWDNSKILKKIDLIIKDKL